MSIFGKNKKNNGAKGDRCPLMGGKKCIEHECVYYQPIMLVDNSKRPPEMFEQYNCSTVNEQIYLRNISQALYESGAATESLRNEVVKESQLSRHENNQYHKEAMRQPINVTHASKNYLEQN